MLANQRTITRYEQSDLKLLTHLAIAQNFDFSGGKGEEYSAKAALFEVVL